MTNTRLAPWVTAGIGIGLLAACAAAQPGPHSTTASSAEAGGTAPSATANPSDAPEAGAARPMALAIDAGMLATDASVIVPSWRSSISFSNITGRTGDQTAALFTPSVSVLEGCRGANGGKLVLRLHSEGGHLVGETQAGSSIDPTAKQCVLEALSKIHVDDTSNVGGAAPVKPMGFTSLLTIEW